ncbi:hypothetical protein SB5_19590 [Pseudomonas oryzihabitans]|nr:hypothetical protein SB5_19590 [Pseudomonas psychrotolerans]
MVIESQKIDCSTRCGIDTEIKLLELCDYQRRFLNLKILEPNALFQPPQRVNARMEVRTNHAWLFRFAVPFDGSTSPMILDVPRQRAPDSAPVWRG